MVSHLPGITRTLLESAISPAESHMDICKMGIITHTDFLRLKRDVSEIQRLAPHRYLPHHSWGPLREEVSPAVLWLCSVFHTSPHVLRAVYTRCSQRSLDKQAFFSAPGSLTWLYKRSQLHPDDLRQ